MFILLLFEELSLRNPFSLEYIFYFLLISFISSFISFIYSLISLLLERKIFPETRNSCISYKFFFSFSCRFEWSFSLILELTTWSNRMINGVNLCTSQPPDIKSSCAVMILDLFSYLFCFECLRYAKDFCPMIFLSW